MPPAAPVGVEVPSQSRPAHGRWAKEFRKE